MNIDKISIGKNPPEDFNVIVEIPMHSGPVKYELDKEAGVMVVDRFMATPMYYPCNYGFIPHTLSEDGDPVDVLIFSPMPLIAGSVINCRAVAMLKMEDESGFDAKILAVPVKKVSPNFVDIQCVENIPLDLREKIEHFFEHYKDLEENKWVKLQGWGDAKEARTEILSSIERHKETAVAA